MNKQIVVNFDNLMLSLENIWIVLTLAANKTADLEQALIKQGYEQPIKPIQLNELLEQKIKPIKESIREAIQITLECRKAAHDKIKD